MGVGQLLDRLTGAVAVGNVRSHDDDHARGDHLVGGGPERGVADRSLLRTRWISSPLDCGSPIRAPTRTGPLGWRITA